MHQLTGIALCAFLFVFTVTGEDSDDEDLPSVTMEVLSSGDNMTSDDISVGHMNKSSSSNLSESYTTHKSDTGLENSTESRIFAESNADGDLDWLNDAIRDVTYYLRAYKFNEYDRRYQKEAPESPGQFFKSYPKRPLRSLHWEVQKHCELSFLSCLKYLSKRIKLTILHREDDTSEVINKQKWYNSTYKKQIDGVDADCQVMKEKDEKFFRPFQGPIERFQWRTTASYYLCWYTMNEVPNLKKLGERCDNFANCLDPQYGANNKDVRASDDKPYQCMLYSVCPDPCCPLRHITNYDECWNNEVNPCFQDNPIGNRQCLFERNRNTDFRDIVLNRWNVTCACSQSGYIWESRFGTCVDINECAIGNHNCDESSEVCVNLPGSYRCLCNWGYLWINKLNRCETSLALDLIKSHQQPICNFNRTKTFSGSLIKYIKSKLFSNSNRNDSQQYKNCGMSFYILATLIAGITFKFLFNLEKY